MAPSFPPPPAQQPAEQATEQAGVPGAAPANPTKSTGPVARWVLAGGALAGSAFLAGYLYLIDPNNPSNAYPKCPMKAFTGIDCPGCGGLRATHAMLHGDFHSAIDHNVLAVILVPLMAYMLVRWMLAQFDIELPRIPWPRWTSWALPIALLLFTVLRAIPNTPFAYFNSETSG